MSLPSVFNELIQNILSLHENTNDNLALSRNQICNGFGLPFVLNYGFQPLPPQRPLAKHYFRIDNNTGIIEVLLNDSLRLAILPDTNTYYEYQDNIIIIVADVPNKNVIVYFPRINNYTKQLVINCDNHDEAVNSFAQLNSLLEEIIGATPEQQKSQTEILQIFSEKMASEDYGTSGQRFDFCKLLVKEVNNLLYSNDEQFIDFIATKIINKANAKERLQDVKGFIRKALSLQDTDLRYYLSACSQSEYEKLMRKLPNKPSPATLPKNYDEISYIDYSHQIPSNVDESSIDNNQSADNVFSSSHEKFAINDEKSSAKVQGGDTLNIDDENHKVDNDKPSGLSVLAQWKTSVDDNKKKKHEEKNDSQETVEDDYYN